MILASLKYGFAQMRSHKRMVLVFYLANFFFGLLLLLPFRAMLGTPVEIAAGRLAGLDALRAIGLQCGWCVVIVALARFAWRRGVRRYEAFGA